MHIERNALRYSFLTESIIASRLFLFRHITCVADRFRDRDQQAGDRGKHLFPNFA